MRLDIYGLYQDKNDHQSMMGCFTADMANTFETKLEEKSGRAKTDESR